MAGVLDFTIMWRDVECTHIYADKTTNTVKVEYFIDHLIKRSFNKKNPTYKDVVDFLESRCFPITRVNRNELLSMLGLSTYNPINIVKKTHGVLYDDYNWIKFKGETLKFDDVKIRE